MEQIASKPLEYEKYVVIKKTSKDLPKGHWTYIAMIDRHKSRQHWWTVNVNMAMQYNLKSAAEERAKSLKYGPCIAIKLSEFDNYVGREFWKQTIIKNAHAIVGLEAKENQFDFEDASSEASAQEVYDKFPHTTNKKKHHKKHHHHHAYSLTDAIREKESFGHPTEDYDDTDGDELDYEANKVYRWL